MVYCCCCPWADDDELHGGVDGNPGPIITRRCTDFPCLTLPFAVSVGVFVLFNAGEHTGNVLSLRSGHDHYGDFCGVGAHTQRPFVFYPDLVEDLRLARRPYGVCVNTCPQVGARVNDYGGQGGVQQRRRDWFVSLPSLPVAGRCVPYEMQPNFTSDLTFCAYPRCDDRWPMSPKEALSITTVCGVRRDGTDRFWLLTMPDWYLKQAWLSEGTPWSIVLAREKVVKLALETNQVPECEYKAIRDVRVRVLPEQSGFHQQTLHWFARFTGAFFQCARAIWESRYLVFGLGIVAALVMSFICMSLMTCWLRMSMMVLLILLFSVLIVADYIFFVQAKLFTGGTGTKVMEYLEKTTGFNIAHEVDIWIREQSDDPLETWLYKWIAIGLAIFTVILAAVCVALRRNFQTMFAMLEESAHTIREMPSMLMLPFFVITTFTLGTAFLGLTFVGIATAEAGYFAKEAFGGLFEVSTDLEESVQKGCMWFVVFCMVWLYYLHVAVFISIIGFAVSSWYFYRDDPESKYPWLHGTTKSRFFRRPMIISTLNVCRYNLGSLAYGSFIMAIVTMPRLVLEYISEQTKASENEVTLTIVCIFRCCLCCFENYLQLLTEYSYIYITITGQPFCMSAHKSFVLFAKYPVQVALDRMASYAVGVLICATVPLVLGIVAFFAAPLKDSCVSFVSVAILAFFTSRLCTGVYDVVVTALFVCVMRDCEHYGGRYMTMNIAKASGLKRDARTPTKKSMSEVEIELMGQ